MCETVTVDEAISRGRRMITYPLTIIAVLIIIPCFYLNGKHILSTSYLLIGIIAGLTVAWLYRSVMIAKWRIWAFDNVRNIHELKKMEARLIGSDGGFWEKTEIRSRDDKQKLATLESKFEKDDVFTDDYAVPDETMIYYSKPKGFFNLVFAFGMIGIGIYLLTEAGGESYIAGIGLCAFGAYLGYKEFSYVTNKEPQIILNKKGIQTASTPFYEWKDISYEEVTREYSNKHTYYYFQYNCPAGGIKLEISDYDINQKGLENLLHVYKVRSKTKPGH